MFRTQAKIPAASFPMAKMFAVNVPDMPSIEAVPGPDYQVPIYHLSLSLSPQHFLYIHNFNA